MAERRIINGWIYEKDAQGNIVPVGPAPQEQAAQPAISATPLPRNPDTVAKEQRAAAEQAASNARESERLRLAQEAADIRQKAEARTQAEFEGTGGTGTVDERRIATLLTRIAGGAADIAGIASSNPGAQSPGFVEAVRGDLMPGGVGGIVTRAIAGGERRSAHDAQRDMLDAALTLGTGAAYNDEQLTGQMASYFPQYGDTPEEVAIKNNRLYRLIEAAKANAGPAWARVEPKIAPFMETLNKGADGFTGYDEENGLQGRVSYDPGSSVPSLSEFGQGIAQGVGNIVNGAMSLPETILNPIGQALYDATGYGNYRYDASDTMRSAFGLPQGPRGVNSSMQEGAISALTGAGAARAASSAFGGTTGAVLNTLGRTPLRDAAAGAGAGAGLELGGDAGEYLGGQTGRAVGGMVGGLAGGMLGYGAANRGASMGGPRTPNPTMRAATDLGIELMPADVGGTATKMATGAIGSTLGNIPMVAGAQRSIASAADAARGLTNRMGGASDTQGAGQALRRGFKEWEAGAKTRADDLYSRVPVASDALVELGTTRAALGEMTNKFRSNPKLANIWRSDERLSQTLDALVPEAQPMRGPDGQVTMQQVPGTGQLSWSDMNAFRSQIGEIIGRPGIKSDGASVGELKNLYRALSQDMERTAMQAGPRALAQWKRAVAFERGRNKRQEDVFAVLFGDKDGRSDEKVFGQIGNWAKDGTGDFKSFARAMRSMPKEEADTVRATWVLRAGRATRANQEGAESDVFSPKQFAASWHGMDKRARAVMFPNAKHRADMEKMVRVMDGMKTADQYTNYSRTGLSVTGAVQTGALVVSPLTAVLTAVGQLGAGALLASPRFARMIASSSRLPATAQGRRLGQELGVLAGQQGPMASEAASVLRAMNDNATMVGAASADETNEERKRRY